MQKNNQDGNIKKITVDTFNIHRYFFTQRFQRGNLSEIHFFSVYDES